MDADLLAGGVFKAITAAASLLTAFFLVRLMPQALLVPRPGSLQRANDRLRKTSEELGCTQALLETRIEERKAELRRANEEPKRENAERRHTEEALEISQDKLRHAHKMEAVGRLAGGVAHDFNNLLSVVLSYTGILLDGMPDDHAMHHELKQIEAAGLRAESRTHQLLAFSRQQVLQPKPVQLNDVVVGVQTMLGRLIGEHIEIVTSVDPTLGRAHLESCNRAAGASTWRAPSARGPRSSSSFASTTAPMWKANRSRSRRRSP